MLVCIDLNPSGAELTEPLLDVGAGVAGYGAARGVGKRGGGSGAGQEGARRRGVACGAGGKWIGLRIDSGDAAYRYAQRHNASQVRGDAEPPHMSLEFWRNNSHFCYFNLDADVLFSL